MFRNKMKVRISLLFSLIASIAISILIGYVALQHNPMQVYRSYDHSTGKGDILWGNLFPVVAVWFLLAFLACLLVLGITVVIACVVTKKEKK